MVLKQGSAKYVMQRHFKLDYNKNIYLTSNEFSEWIENYDILPFKNPVFSDKNHSVMVTSTLQRAINSANYYKYERLISSELFNEVKIAPPFQTNLKLPLWFWLFSARLAWLFCHKSQPETVLQTIKRAKECSEFLKNLNGEVLVISHGFFMAIFKLV